MVKHEEKQMEIFPEGPSVPAFSSHSASSSRSWLAALLTDSCPKFTTRHLTEPCPSDRFLRDSSFYIHFHEHLPCSFTSAARHTESRIFLKLQLSAHAYASGKHDEGLFL